MKWLLQLGIVLLAVPFSGFSQGTVGSNFLGFQFRTCDGEIIPAGDTFLAGVFYAPLGELDERNFILLGSSISFLAPGIIIGGIRYAPVTPPGAEAHFQLRIWERAFGETYEESRRNGGRVGASNIVKVDTGNPLIIPPEDRGHLTRSGLEPFCVQAEDRPADTLTLSAVTGGGGRITVVPDERFFAPGALVSITASPAEGWTFLGWHGVGAPAGSNLNLTMTRDRSITAIFGTRFASETRGSGSIVKIPDLDLYPYGFEVRLHGFPAPDHYLADWDGEVWENPARIRVSRHNQNVLADFQPLPPGMCSLTVLPFGGGEVAVNPVNTLYALGTSVQLTPLPGPRQIFQGWTASHRGREDPLLIVMDQSKVLRADFIEQPKLRLDPGSFGFGEGGFSLTLEGLPGSAATIERSTDAVHWQSIGTVTNLHGQAQFVDPAATEANRGFYRAGARLPGE